MKKKRSRRFERLNKKELREFVLDYHRAFPDWLTPTDQTWFSRFCGPFEQQIWFDCLGRGDYRTTGSVGVFSVPGTSTVEDLHLYLSGRVYTVPRGLHTETRDRVVEAIHREFVPSVDKPLDARWLLKYYEKTKRKKPHDACNLASIHAFYGNYDKAIYWSSQYVPILESRQTKWYDYNFKQRSFLDTLEQWIAKGTAQEEIRRVVQQERERLGLV